MQPSVDRLGAHEMMEVHELLNFKTISAAKAKGMDGLVTDQELKELLAQELQASLQAMNQLQTLLTHARTQQTKEVSPWQM